MEPPKFITEDGNEITASKESIRAVLCISDDSIYTEVKYIASGIEVKAVVKYDYEELRKWRLKN